jgi:hypothetical protein
MNGDDYGDLLFTWAGKPPEEYVHLESFEAEFSL